jgi:hypothetical protein
MNIFLNEIKNYNTRTEQYQELAASELLQKIILAGLSETGFFEKAVFHGGTALRILYGLHRFSQDLDFSLIRKNEKFIWKNYLEPVVKRMGDIGCSLELYDKSHRESSIVIAEIRDLSIGRMLNFDWSLRPEHPKKIMVKLELDSDPPSGGKTVQTKIKFPFQCKIRHNDLPTLFAGKTHALLCRDYGEYIKGRDWYDFLWYTKKGIEPNYSYLSDALNRHGPWNGQNIKVTQKWLIAALNNKIRTLDINAAKRDIVKFLDLNERENVNNWDRENFFDAIKELQVRIMNKRSNNENEMGR